MSPIDRDALLQTFLAEAEESLARMEDRLLALEEDPETPDAPDALAEIFRVVHTLKGNAGIFGFSSLTAMGHALEDVLDPVRAGKGAVDAELTGLMLDGLDGLRRSLANAVAGDDRTSADDERLLGRLAETAKALRDPSLRHPAAPAGPGTAPQSADPHPEQGTAPGTASARRAADLRDRTLRVGVDRLDRLVDVAGEIGIGRGRVIQMLEDPAVSKEVVLQALREADYLHLELQELVMQLRTIPVRPSLMHHRRTVHDTAAALGKRAQLVLEGEDVELDMSVVEHLRDPLTHMIRNAVGHGIETPTEREAAGKDPVGRVTVRTLAESGSIVIQVSDDGRGLDRERILRRGRSSGLIGAGETPPAGRLDGLIFEPGFSTVESVTDLSGRGVGMDVVRRNTEALRGSVRVVSRPGRGTTFTLRMPLTLAVIDGFMVEVADETYILPLEAVVETIGVPQGLALDHRGGRDGSGVASLRGNNLGCVRLRRVLGIDGAPASRESVVVVRHGGRELGLVVDALHGEQQTVLKPVPKLFRGLPGIAGSAILGNGRVALILDVAELLALHAALPEPVDPAPERRRSLPSSDRSPQVPKEVSP